MIDHASIGVRDLQASTHFYTALLAPLGFERLVERPHMTGFGKRYPELWLNARPGMPPVADDTGVHLCLRAADEDAVRAFHAAALAHGGRCDGPPGERQAAMTGYYGAFVRDLDGNKLEAVTFPRPD